MPRTARSPEEIVDGLLKRATPLNSCLICHLHPSIDERGRRRHFVQVGGRSGDKWRVTRLIWHVKKGPIPFDLLVLHTCDNTECISLEHLFLGTSSDNTQDMIAKGRHQFILPNNIQKANPEQIRQLRQEGLTYVQIGERLGISPSTACNYCVGSYRDR